MIAAAILATTSASAQTPDDPYPLRFQHLGLSTGLSLTTPSEFLQDSRGFMWIATLGGGLNRYDGRKFRVYRPMPRDSTSISHAVSISLYEDRDGAMWIGTWDGLNRYSHTDDAFQRFMLRDVDAGRNLDDDTAATGESATDDTATGDTAETRNITPPIAYNTPSIPTDNQGEPVSVLAMDEDEAGNLWLMTSRGIVRRSRGTGNFALELPRDEPMVAPDGGVAFGDILCLEDGSVWFANGLSIGRYDPQSDTHETYISDPSTGVRTDDYFAKIIVDRHDPDVLWIAGTGVYRLRRSDGTWQNYRRPPPLDRRSLVDIVHDPANEHRMWLSGYESGLVSLDTETLSFTTIAHDPTNPSSLASNTVNSIYFDRSGLLWVATGGSGADRVDLTGGEFRNYQHIDGDASTLPTNEIRDIVETSDGRIWVATPTRGFASIEPDGLVRRYDLDRRIDVVWNLAASADGTIWVGLRGGAEVVLYRFDPRTQQVQAYPEAVPSATPSIGSLLEADDGRLWVGTLDGINRLDPATGAVETDLLGRPVDVSHLYTDHAGRLWVSTRNAGVARYDPTSGDIAWYDAAGPNGLPDQWVTGVMQRAAEPNVFWISMYGGGLARLDESTGDLQTWSTDDGLPDNVIYGLLEDDDGQLWMSSNRGIARFDPEADEFRTFGMERGIQSWEFNQLAVHRSPRTGLMYFGGINGLNVFDPDELLTNTAPPPVVLTDFLMDNRSVRPGPDSPLETSISVADEITLRHDENAVGFEFAALDYKYPEQNRYRYMLEGFDAEWVEAGAETKASYTNLRGGEYTFRVYGSNGDGVWSETPAEVVIRVLPPWWRTWWAYVGYTILLVAAFVAVDRVQRRRVLAKERERTRERELEQARKIEKAYHDLREAKDRLVQQEKLASLGSLTAGIAHEIKNPLNFVNNFADLNDELAEELLADLESGNLDAARESAAGLRQNAKVIAEHGKRADAIVKGMMAHASGEQSARTSVDVNALVSEYVDLAWHGRRARAPKFNVTLNRDLDPQAGNVSAVGPDLGRVVLNLVSNAFDAVVDRANGATGDAPDDYKPTVTVSTKREDGRIDIRVADNGPGVPDAVRARVFEPFFTTKPAGAGTGLGLSLSHEIVTTGHGGTLSVEDGDDGGAAFVVTLPDGSMNDGGQVLHRASGSR